MDAERVVYKSLGSIQIAAIKTQIFSRDQIPLLLVRVREACGNAIDGNPMVIFHEGAVKDGSLIEAAYPVLHPVEEGEIYTHQLEAVRVFSKVHYGAHTSIQKTIKEIYQFLHDHAWAGSLFTREVYNILDMDHPEKNITEVQVVLHEWETLFANGVEQVLGSDVRKQIVPDFDSIDENTSFAEYTNWIRKALQQLDLKTDDAEKKCRIVSQCAHVFPQERIDYLRNLYLQGGVDTVLNDMYDDNFWYELPVRRGNVLYMRKNPYNPEGYNMAKTAIERRQAYCHCAFVRPFLADSSSQLSSTFCFCGAGWYRRLWEGILNQPVQFEFVETLLKGKDQCTFRIILPLDLSGECLPKSLDV